jgi:hypothetical protein
MDEKIGIERGRVVQRPVPPEQEHARVPADPTLGFVAHQEIGFGRYNPDALRRLDLGTTDAIGIDETVVPTRTDLQRLAVQHRTTRETLLLALVDLTNLMGHMIAPNGTVSQAELSRCRQSLERLIARLVVDVPPMILTPPTFVGRMPIREDVPVTPPTAPPPITREDFRDLYYAVDQAGRTARGADMAMEVHRNEQAEQEAEAPDFDSYERH